MLKNGNLTTDVHLLYARGADESEMQLRGVYITPSSVDRAAKEGNWVEVRVDHFKGVSLEMPDLRAGSYIELTNKLLRRGTS